MKDNELTLKEIEDLKWSLELAVSSDNGYGVVPKEAAYILNLMNNSTCKCSNKVTIKIKTCHDCPHLDHNGLLQNTTYYVCRRNNSKKIKKMDKPTYEFSNIVNIPEWCPLKNSNKNEE